MLWSTPRTFLLGAIDRVHVVWDMKLFQAEISIGSKFAVVCVSSSTDPNYLSVARIELPKAFQCLSREERAEKYYELGYATAEYKSSAQGGRLDRFSISS